MAVSRFPLVRLAHLLVEYSPDLSDRWTHSSVFFVLSGDPNVPLWGSRGLCCIGWYALFSQSCHLHFHMDTSKAHHHFHCFNQTLYMAKDKRFKSHTIFHTDFPIIQLTGMSVWRLAPINSVLMVKTWIVRSKVFVIASDQASCTRRGRKAWVRSSQSCLAACLHWKMKEAFCVIAARCVCGCVRMSAC